MSIAETRSHFTVTRAEELAYELYGLIVTARPLPSERDQNFHLVDDQGREYVLKIANAADTQATLEFQNAVLEFLSIRPDFSHVARLLPTCEGYLLPAIPDVNGDTLFVRLLTYLPGKPLGEVKPHSPELLRSLGTHLGRLDRALADFGQAPPAQETFNWDVLTAPTVIGKFLPHIHGDKRRALVHHFLDRFEQLFPSLSTLNQQVIHNDPNDYNILVENGHITGIIDYGDMVLGDPVYDLAIALAYVMLGKADPLAAARPVIAGYHAERLLNETELALLYDLIAIRLATSVSVSAYQQKQEPDNDYLSISEAPAWEMLQTLADLPPALAHYTFRAACDLPPCPHSPALVEWLQTHQADFAPLVEPPLTEANTLVFDLSVGSPDIPDVRLLADTAAFSKLLFDKLDVAGAMVGVGRYNEPRLLYSAPQFDTATDELPETRTIHLGLDLFLPPGSPLFAPLAGVVHSLQNNNAPQDYGPTVILRHQPADCPAFFTLYGHLSPDSLDGLAEGQVIDKGRRLARIGNYPANGNWPPHLHFQIIADLLDSPLPLGEGLGVRATAPNFPGVAAPGGREVWLSLSPDPNLIARIPAACFPSEPLSPAENLARRQQHLSPSLSISYQQPLKMVRGAGQFLYDYLGRAYLDAVNNVPHVGHSHPHVVQAGQRQMALLNTNTRYLYDSLVQYAERLCATLPNPLNVCFFVCTGSEANDLALRLARTHTGSRDVIIVDGAYHGNLSSLIQISPYKYAGPGGPGRATHVQEVLMPDVYRGPYKNDDPQAGQKYAAHVRQAIENIKNEGRGVAAFFAESLLGCGGQLVLPAGYLAEAYKHVRAAGGVCVADEVQVGFGRVGSHFWGFETQGVVPDIVTLGKPMGNGHPLAAVVTTPEIAASFNNGMEYFNTFGGNPVSCAIGLAVLEVIEQEGLQQNALAVGRRLLVGLAALKEKYPVVGDVRGLGLYVGVELVRDRDTLEAADEEATYIANRMKEHGILISTDGPLHNVLKIKPPLVFTQADADRLVATLDKILQEDLVRFSSP